MKSLIAVSVLLSLFSLSLDVAPADINLEARERIQELVVERLQGRSILWSPSAFSRARTVVQPAELRLSTSSSRTDVEERIFVPFRVEEVGNEDESMRPLTFTGCYYPAADAAFIELEGTDVALPFEEHPSLMLGEWGRSIDEAACRTED